MLSRQGDNSEMYDMILRPMRDGECNTREKVGVLSEDLRITKLLSADNADIPIYFVMVSRGTTLLRSTLHF